jgi:imidazoleglycerol-phosphate dehydratase / histidinol-phosphatase
MASSKSFLFIDRDGTLASLSADTKNWLPAERSILALNKLSESGFGLVLLVQEVPTGLALGRQQALVELFQSQGICFDDVLLCPHDLQNDCVCRKPHLGLLRTYLTRTDIDWTRSQLIGDEAIDNTLAENAGIPFIRFNAISTPWERIASQLLTLPRKAEVNRKTKETSIKVNVDLDGTPGAKVATGIGYFDHMLEQLAKHGGFELKVDVQGDLNVDEHHTVEDTALAIGEAIRRALGDKLGIGRYGFVVPMDEAESRVSIDLSARPHLNFVGNFPREYVGELPTELVPHFYRSFSDMLGATLHIEVFGENAHHMVESTFKAVGRALRTAIGRGNTMDLPSTKGTL